MAIQENDVFISTQLDFSFYIELENQSSLVEIFVDRVYNSYIEL
jgi:hypothetical protein